MVLFFIWFFILLFTGVGLCLSQKHMTRVICWGLVVAMSYATVRSGDLSLSLLESRWELTLLVGIGALASGWYVFGVRRL